MDDQDFGHFQPHTHTENPDPCNYHTPMSNFESHCFRCVLVTLFRVEGQGGVHILLCVEYIIIAIRGRKEGNILENVDKTYLCCYDNDNDNGSDNIK